MQTFNSGGGKPHIMEQVTRWAIPAGLIFLGAKFFNSAIAPTLISLFDNLTAILGGFWATAALGIPAVFIVMYVISNPQFIAMTYKNLCRKITGFFIKLDFLSYMDSYVDTLKQKLKNLELTKTALKAKRIELERMTNDIMTSFNLNMKKAKAAKEMASQLDRNDPQYASLMQTSSHHASMGSTDKQSIDSFKPMLDRMDKNLKFLDKLATNWGFSIEKLQHEVKRKRVEYETLKKMAHAIGQAEDFARGDTEAAKIYQASVAALEASLTEKIATIEEFEKKSKTVMDSIDLEKQMIDNEGMALLDEYERNGNSIFLPEDYQEAVVVKSTPGIPANSKFAELLKKSS